MSSWAARAKAAISEMGQGGTAKTDESRLSAVLAVPTLAEPVMPDRFSAVLAVPSPAVFEKPADWYALDAAYLAHHFNCQTCIAAGRGIRYGGRCAVGLAMWNDYSRSATSAVIPMGDTMGMPFEGNLAMPQMI